MIRALISTLFALSIFVCVVGQTIYGPTGSSPMFEPYIQSATGDVRGTLWVLANSTRYVTAINTNTGTTTVIDLAGSSNGTTPAVITRIRVAYSGLYGNVMFAQDVANDYIAMYSLDQQGALIRTINVFGYQTFQVSPSGGYLAVGGVEGSEYIDFIDVYATNGAGYMHRIQLTGLQSRGFAFNQMGDMLAVSIGLNNTISMIAAQTNIYIYSETFPLPIDGFAIDAIAIQGSTFTLVDCNQSSVVIANNREGFSYGFQFYGINMSQCGEAVTTLGQSSFAVLDGTYSVNYFGKISNTSSSSTGSAPSSTGVAPSTGYFPSGSSPVFGYDIQSVTSNFTGTMWVMTGSRQQQALQYTNYDGSTVWVDLTINQPSSSLPAVITRVRAANSNVYGNLLFMEDVANNWIAMYSLDYNFHYTGGFIRSINVFGYQTYQVSADARYLAVGGVMGSEYIDFIDMYNLTATNSDGYMYRIGLAGSQVRDFAFNDQTNFLYVPNGNNTMSTYNAMNGNSITYPTANLPPSFTAHAIAVDRRNSWALVDCDQGIVVMTDWLTQATTNYTLQGFNSSQCTEAVTTIGWSSFAVLNGGNRYSFFAYGSMAPSSTAPRSSSTGRASSTGVAPSSTGVAPSTGYTPSGNSPIIVDVMSGSGNVTGALWVISSSYQGPGAVLIDTNTQASRFVQLTTNQPNSSLPAVITRVRPANHPAYGNLLFMEDSANNYIAMYALDNNRGFIRSINVFGYQTYQVSPDGRFLAVGGVAGSPYIDFIDMYDLTVTNGDGYMYRIGLNGAQCRGFAFSFLSRGWLFVPMGVNNTAVVYDLQMGTVVQWVFFPSSLQPFTIGAIAVDVGYNMALVDCDQGMVAFIPRSIQLATNYTLQQFNYTQCSEAVTTIGPYAFAVLTGGTLQGGNSYVYFEPSSISDEHWEVANDSSVSTVSSLSSVEIAFIIIGAVALFALVVASVIMLKARFVSKHKQVEGNSLLAVANQA